MLGRDRGSESERFWFEVRRTRLSRLAAIARCRLENFRENTPWLTRRDMRRRARDGGRDDARVHSVICGSWRVLERFFGDGIERRPTFRRDSRRSHLRWVFHRADDVEVRDDRAILDSSYTSHRVADAQVLFLDRSPGSFGGCETGNIDMLSVITAHANICSTDGTYSARARSRDRSTASKPSCSVV